MLPVMVNTDFKRPLNVDIFTFFYIFCFTNTGADIVKILHNQIYPQNDDLIILIPN